MSNLARANSVDAVVRRSAARTPNAVALHFADRALTYAELDAAVSRAAGRLLSLGLEPGDRIAAYGTNSDAYAIAFFAASRAGLIHVPINYALQGEELTYILADSGATVLVVDAALRPRFEEIAADTSVRHVLDFREGPDSLLVQAGSGEVPELSPPEGGDELVQLMYTSGTTSKPKGTKISHSGQIHHYLSCLQALDYTPDDRPLVCMPLYHTAAMHAFLVPYLAIGAEVFLHERPDIPTLLETIERERIGSMFLAPTVWVPLANHPDLDKRDISSLKKAQYGASIMPTPVLQRLRKRYPELGFYNAFGQTEIGPVATVLRPEEHDERPASAGRPVMFVEARVIDPEGNDVAPGEQGEIVYRSPQLCLGYWNKPEATDEAFKGGWFHSGDLVVRDSEGFVTVVDRIKDVINTGGILVASREVEEAVYEHEAVAEVAVVGMPHERWIEQVTAFIVVKDGMDEPSEDEIIEVASRHLASFKMPKQVIVVPQLPRNQSGKLLKRVLREGAEE
ncbi:fatty acyl-CoA synthetase [Dietzia sp.]|uniref:fatty acyl-CoA synthetase n=1 Tax=Dietzia sp. TaxID=1871616 RepID=UPI002FDA34DF